MHDPRPAMSSVTASSPCFTPILVIELDPLIEIKAHLTRPKDKVVEAELRAIRDRLRGGLGGSLR